MRLLWITASLQAGRLLPVEDFQLSAVCDKPGQRKIMDFKQHDTAAIAPEQLYPQLQQQQRQQQQQQQQQWQQQMSDQQSSVIPNSLVCPLQGNHVHGSLQQQHQQLQGYQPQASAFLQAPPSFHPAPSLLPYQLAQQTPLQAQVHLQQHFHNNQHQQQQHQQIQHQPHPLQQQQQQQQQQQPYPHAPPPVAGASGNTVGTMEEAQALCARLRSECDLLRGAPRSSRDDPGFMDSYFRSSRLHHIGTWKSRIEALMAEDDIWGPQPLPVQGARQPAGTLRQFMRPSTGSAAATNASSAPGNSITTGTSNTDSNPRAATPAPPEQLPTERAIIHLDMDCFFAAASVVDYPVLRGKGGGVCHWGGAHGTGGVSAANYEARAFGVRAGYTIGAAKQMCPHVLVVPYMFDKYTEISEQVSGADLLPFFP
ncbi:hypothetical protein DUNSADRAFT_184 [Dunaliella salina]|uniref:UmuC domain-containing protein n=1 Tax=Dunaliella salina TaxID=3046 RepID=A0ABQ7FZD6_DUNSA|nr:hypothetical protein DUNSADRAFT_184 [Dunaliella salina]|eukprot:KAF5827717.1 hypothetical protein DUNSADRAFT_184 [Dunaliella salina]